MTPWERYFLAGRRAGCPMGPMDKFASADVVLQERQLAASAAARRCDAPDGPMAIGYGGARGGGKSHWLLAQMGADDLGDIPRDTRAGVAPDFSAAWFPLEPRAPSVAAPLRSISFAWRRRPARKI